MLRILKSRPWFLGSVVMLLGVLIYFSMRDSAPEAGGLTFAARRGTLQISVLEGGSIEARESQEIRSEVKGYQGTKILSIVEEGYLVTEGDVQNGKVLVELDSSELQQKITTQDIQVQSSQASLIEAQQAYEIQLNQNNSDIKAAEQAVRFAHMDLEKFLGDELAKQILSELDLQLDKILGETNAVGISTGSLDPAAVPVGAQLASLGSGRPEVMPDAGAPGRLLKGLSLQEQAAQPATNAPSIPSFDPSVYALPAAGRKIEFSQYAKEELLGDGEAQQKLRKLQDDLLLAQNELGLAQTKLEGTMRLQEKDFVTKTELVNEQLTVKKADLKVATGQTALDLFIKYEFSKTAEELLSKYDEALQSLTRARKAAISKLAQAHAKWRSSESRYRIETAQQKELYDQLAKCVIRAQKPGLVVYGGGNDRRYYYGEDQIREGATVRERQPIITIPNMTQMSVKLKIHEAQIKKVKKGMPALIRVDAFADKQLTGEVAKVGVLPDSQDRYMNPDMKVYLTEINVHSTHEWLKPGMSAKVEVRVNELPDVIHIPLQAVTPIGNKHFCYVMNGGSREQREIEVGGFNDEFIEIKSGVAEGELVALRGPEAPPAASSLKPEEASGQEQPANPPPAGQPRSST